MPKFSWNPFSKGGLPNQIFQGSKNLMGPFLGGTPEKRENVSTLRPEQEGIYNQLIGAGMAPGAGGAFGQSADYYRGLLGNENQDFNAFAAPQLRQYNEDIVPGLSEQFAQGGGGQGNFSSSGFRNAQTQGATDLAERLGAIRANLRQSGAQGLQNIGNLGLGNYSQNMTTQQGTGGFLEQVAPLLGTAAGAYLGGPAGAGIGGQLGSWFGGQMGNRGNLVGASRGPYDSWSPQASPSLGQGTKLGGY